MTVHASSGGAAGLSRRWLIGLVAGLIVLGTFQRVHWLRPSSLWVDDAWPTLAIKAHTPRELLFTGGTAPGFALLMRLWLRVVGFSELRAQMLPFVAGVATAPLLFLASLRRGIRPAAGLVAAVLIATSPTHATYSVRVKQYSLETVLTVLILFLCMGLLERPDNLRLWVATLIACIGATAFSGTLGIIAIVGIGTALLGSMKTRTRVGTAAAIFVAIAGFAGAWWIVVLRPAANETLRRFWTGYYIELHRSDAFGTLRVALERLSSSISAVQLPWLIGALFVVGIALLLRRNALVALLTGAPLAAAIVLAAAHRAPIGARTDQYIYPAIAVVVGVGADGLRRGLARSQVVKRAAGASAIPIVALTVALALLGTQDPYPAEDVKPFVHRIELGNPRGAATVIYWPAAFAFALYTRWPVHLVPTTLTANGFIPAIVHPDVYVAPDYASRPERYREFVHGLDRYDKVWFVATHLLHKDDKYISESLYRAGYRIAISERRPGAYAALWTRGSRNP